MHLEWICMLKEQQYNAQQEDKGEIQINTPSFIAEAPQMEQHKEFLKFNR